MPLTVTYTALSIYSQIDTEIDATVSGTTLRGFTIITITPIPS